MERLTQDDHLYRQLERANSVLADLLRHTQAALRGECEFGVEQVRAVAKPISEIAPLLGCGSFRQASSNVADEIARYKALLQELQPALESIRIMLLARQAQLTTGKDQLTAMSQWAEALGKTR